MHRTLVHVLAALVLLSQGWLGVVRGHSVVVEVGGCGPGHAHACAGEHHGQDRVHGFAHCHEHDRAHAPHRALDPLASTLHDHSHDDLGCHMHLCLPELEQRSTDPVDVRGFARLWPAGVIEPVLLVSSAPAPGVRAIDRWAKGPPLNDALALASTILLL
ncbi:MAG: hypothetical protein ACKO0W_01050 [Planctomycetota bacterium]